MITPRRATTVASAIDHDASALWRPFAERLTWRRRFARLFWLVTTVAVNGEVAVTARLTEAPTPHVVTACIPATVTLLRAPVRHPEVSLCHAVRASGHIDLRQ